MLKIEPISLDVIFPSNWINMVVMQPHVYLTISEPYRWPTDKKTQQISGINRTLEIAKDQQAHFAIFPEYAIPGLDGVNVVTERVAGTDWPNNTIIIGGVDGLSKEHYQQLCEQPDTTCHDNNKPDQVGPNEWVNCCITWIKKDDGHIIKYIQPKISSAKDEALTPLQSFFCGSAVYLFEGKFCHESSIHYSFKFFTLICFDWIAQSAGCRINESVLRELDQRQQTLEWVFLLQHNPKPNHSDFISSTLRFFDDSVCNNVIRHNSAVIFVNSASQDKPASYAEGNYAVSSIVFHPAANVLSDRCGPTICLKTNKYRNLNTCHDIVFREMGSCIHSFEIHIPRFSPYTPGGQCLPIERAYVYPITDGEPDPRLPGGEVPACVKWVNDMLDKKPSLSDRVSIDHLNHEVTTSHNAIIGTMRQLKADKHENNIHYATASHLSNNEWRNVDNWVTDEENALEHMLDTLTMISTAHDTDLDSSLLHATILIDNKLIELVAIKGSTHEECFKYFLSDHIPRPAAHKTFLITQDDRNSEITDGLLNKFTVPYSSEKKITKPASGYFIKDFQTLLRACQAADSVDSFREGIASYVA